jgi:hypothetical protein
MLTDSGDKRPPRNRPTLKPHSIRQPGHSRVVDGFVKASHLNKNTPTNANNQKLSTASKTSSHKVAPHINRIAEHSKTLMRDAVKKPDITKIKHQKDVAQTHLKRVVERGAAVSAPARETISTHAKAIRNSEFLNKVNQLATPANPIKPNPEIIQTTANSEVHLKNLNHLSQIETGQIDPAVDLEAIFSEASLKLSDSHQPITRKETRFYESIANKLRISVRLLFIISLVLFVLILGSVSSYLFSDNLNMYMANQMTNLHGILPTYSPTGYSIQSIKYFKSKPTGSIQITYASGNGQYYGITEQATTWDSQALVSNTVIPEVGNNFKTYQIAGRSVYIYQQTAVWVDAGIYYMMTNKAGISNNQITQIVNTT